VLTIYLDRLRDELQAITAMARAIRIASVAAMQEQVTIRTLTDEFYSESDHAWRQTGGERAPTEECLPLSFVR
jgi:hypothetical protein